jgi:hypothetical protein
LRLAGKKYAKKIISNFSVILLLGNATLSGVSANANLDFQVPDFSGGLRSENKPNWPQQLTIKKDVPYEEPNDPALRRGTENWEQPQWSFFVVPGIFIGLALVVLFFNRNQ